MKQSRINQLKEMLNNKNIDAFLVNNLLNIRYLTGFSGSAGALLITQDKAYFVTDFRYKTQIKSELRTGITPLIHNQNSFDFLNDLITKHNLKRIGFETSVSFENVQYFKKAFKNVKFLPLSNEIEKIVDVKSDEEISMIKKAAEITDRTFSKLLNIIKPGMTEKEISAEISYIQKKLGAERDSFDSIVAGGENSALPHARPTDRKLKKGDLLTLDFGCTYKGFNSDMTRTLAIGKISSEAKNIYDIVKEAQQRALNAVKSGKEGKTIDAEARDFISSKGYGKNFGHGLGHGLGYAVHESPRLNTHSTYKLKTNNVVTIEPGIYLEGMGGVRIEDDVVVKNGKCEILNKSTKELITL